MAVALISSLHCPVGAALCRERAAKQPQGFGANAQIAGAAAQPFRDTRPLLQLTALTGQAIQGSAHHPQLGIIHQRLGQRAQVM